MRELFFIVLIGCFLKMHINKDEIAETFSVETTSLSYKEDILPIIMNRCSMCHHAGVPERNWLDYNTAYKKRASIKLRLQDRTMPIGITMLETERQLMIDWVNQGAKP